MEELRALTPEELARAEERLRLKDRRPLVQISELKARPHLEMHTRGG